jgi:hypothetical protein
VVTDRAYSTLYFTFAAGLSFSFDNSQRNLRLDLRIGNGRRHIPGQTEPTGFRQLIRYLRLRALSDGFASVRFPGRTIATLGLWIHPDHMD